MLFCAGKPTVFIDVVVSKIMKMDGVVCTHFNMIDYGALWEKSTCALHNSLVLHMLKSDLDIKPLGAIEGPDLA